MGCKKSLLIILCYGDFTFFAHLILEDATFVGCILKVMRGDEEDDDGLCRDFEASGLRGSRLVRLKCEVVGPFLD
jgi:hypothetical protein